MADKPNKKPNPTTTVTEGGTDTTAEAKPKRKGGHGGGPYDRKAFVAAFLTHRNPTKIAEVLGIKLGTVRMRAVALRKQGVNLPRFGRGGKINDVADLNALIEQANKPVDAPADAK